MIAKRQLLLRANSLFLGKAAIGGLAADVLGIFFARGPQASLISAAPHAGIGFIEAHGLALILGMLLWRAAPSRSWHLAASGVHVLLGSANLVFWQIFVATGLLTLGYVTTSLHVAFAVLQLCAAVTSTRASSLEVSR